MFFLKITIIQLSCIACLNESNSFYIAYYRPDNNYLPGIQTNSYRFMSLTFVSNLVEIFHSIFCTFSAVII